jgi:hypothetical protein
MLMKVNAQIAGRRMGPLTKPTLKFSQEEAAFTLCGNLVSTMAKFHFHCLQLLFLPGSASPLALPSPLRRALVFCFTEKPEIIRLKCLGFLSQNATHT